MSNNGNAFSDAVAVVPPTLAGLWKSEKPEPSGNGRYAVREFRFEGNRWELHYTLAADKKMSRILFEHRASGTFTLQKPSQRIAGAYLIVFQNLKKSLRIGHLEKVTEKELGFDVCGIPNGQETDVSGRGCGVIMRVGECPEDFDLVRQESRSSGQYLYLGNRFDEFSSCTEDKRPVALGPILIKNQ